MTRGDRVEGRGGVGIRRQVHLRQPLRQPRRRRAEHVDGQVEGTGRHLPVTVVTQLVHD